MPVAELSIKRAYSVSSSTFAVYNSITLEGPELDAFVEVWARAVLVSLFIRVKVNKSTPV